MDDITIPHMLPRVTQPIQFVPYAYQPKIKLIITHYIPNNTIEYNQPRSILI